MRYTVGRTANALAWSRFERRLSSISDESGLNGVDGEEIYLVATTVCVVEAEEKCFFALFILRSCALATSSLPCWWWKRSRFIVMSSLDDIEDKSTCTLNSTKLSFRTIVQFWTIVHFSFLGLVISKTCFNKLGCLHNLSSNSFIISYSWAQRSNVLWMSLFISLRCTASVITISMKQKNTC